MKNMVLPIFMTGMYWYILHRPKLMFTCQLLKRASLDSGNNDHLEDFLQRQFGPKT